MEALCVLLIWNVQRGWLGGKTYENNLQQYVGWPRTLEYNEQATEVSCVLFGFRGSQWLAKGQETLCGR